MRTAAFALSMAVLCPANAAQTPPAQLGSVAPGTGSSAPSEASEPSPALQDRARDVVRLINGEVKAAQIFSPGALSKVPADRLDAVANAVRRKFGTALGVARIEAVTPHRGRVFITFEQTQLSLRLGVGQDGSHLVNELLLG